MGELLHKVQRDQLSDILVQRITDAIINGELKPGDKIPTEVEFTERLGISRNSVREAIKVLVAFGVLEIRRAQGTFVVQEFNQKMLDPILYGLFLANRSMDDLVEFKDAFLLPVLYLILTHERNEEQLKELERRHAVFHDLMLVDPLDEARCYEASVAFMSYLGEMSGNPLTRQLNDVLLRISKYTRVTSIHNSLLMGRRTDMAEVYAKIVDLIRHGDTNDLLPLVSYIFSVWRSLLNAKPGTADAPAVGPSDPATL